MKDLFKHASSSWVKYDRYEWKKDKNNKFYITPAPNATPKIYDPLHVKQATKERTGSNVASAGRRMISLWLPR